MIVDKWHVSYFNVHVHLYQLLATPAKVASDQISIFLIRFNLSASLFDKKILFYHLDLLNLLLYSLSPSKFISVTRLQCKRRSSVTTAHPLLLHMIRVLAQIRKKISATATLLSLNDSLMKNLDLGLTFICP